ncbi:MAG: DUF2490 domain-containing protein [Flavobacteriales bacterium]
MTLIKHLTFVCLLLPLAAFSQLNDQGAWISLGLKKKLKGPYEIELSPEIRMDQGMSRNASIFVDAAFNYKVNKWASMSAVLRQSWKSELDGAYFSSQRFALDFSFDKSVRKIKCAYRLRLQSQLNSAYQEENPELKQAIRHKFSTKFKVIKKTQASLAFEMFQTVSNTDFTWSDVRCKAQLSRKLKKRNYLTMGYLFQNQLNTKYPLREHVLLVGYKLEIK